MPGWSNADNLFGVSDYIVGTTLGDGCNYDSIQTAINDLVAAGGTGTIWVRQGTYTENLSIVSGATVLNIEICASAVDGRVPSPAGVVNIIGNHTIGGTNFTVAFFENIAFNGAAGDVFLMNPTAGQSILACQECSIVAPAGRGAFLNPGVGAQAQFSTQDCEMTANFQTIDIGAVGGGSSHIRGQFSSSTNNVARIGGPGSVQFDTSAIFGVTNAFALLDAGATVECRNGAVTSGDACFNFLVAGGTVTAIDMTISSADASGNFIVGTGTFSFASIYPTNVLGIDAAVTQQKLNWQPYCETAAAALGSNRGTASFNSAQFSVVDGWVSATGSGLFPWFDQGLSTTVISNSGNFTTAVITLTLPAAPAQGDVCKFKQITNDNIVVAANVGQIIQLGNVGGTQAASSSSGDALEVTFYAAGAIWMANSGWGNWIVT